VARSRIAIAALACALVVSNALWAYQLIDAGVTQSYTDVSLTDNREAVGQLIAVVNEASKPSATRESIIAAAEPPGDSSEPFEKDGYLWTGSIGLKFDSNNHLIGVERAWSPP
jgi:hypothetical protein